MTLAVTVKVLSQCHQPLFTESDVLSHFFVVCVFFFLFFPDDLEMEGGSTTEGKIEVAFEELLTIREGRETFLVQINRGGL